MSYKIKELRERKGMTQEELSKASGVSRAIISGLENGTSKTTTTKTLILIAHALGVAVSDIFFENDV
ncbi:helix-turn-helix transcriptional regulator [Bilifractor sp. LCP19S3_H10]|uniref:helix-turn-helix transcriptional regulator n=1 Tax=Bilifractor sp. LCP19S3_H10 TaxID=3438736 RepID=UPI00301E969B|nr:helix-turn-helix transcriptional regulator [Lachnospiraceae bacterium]